jgi:photosystem II stability/assembly factor-like uncharacterized protein
MAGLQAMAQLSQTAANKKAGAEEEEKEEQVQNYTNTRWFKLMQQPHADYFKIQGLYDKYMRQHPVTEGPKETGDEWLRQNIYYLDNKGRVQLPPGFDYTHVKSGILPSSNVTDTMSGDWRMIGPSNISIPADGTRGGFSFCVRMDPTNNNKMFISFETGGLWTTDNGGKVWHLTDANLPDNVYYDIVPSAANPNVVYAISKDAVIKSTNGGFTWTVTGLNNSIAPYNSAKGVDLAVSPADAGVVVARWGNQLYRTTDGGITWTKVLPSLNKFDADNGVERSGGTLEWSYNDPNRVFLIDPQMGSTSVTIYESRDQGATFSVLANITIPPDIPSQQIGGLRIGTATDQPSTLFAFINQGNSYMQLYSVDVNSGKVILSYKNMINNQPCGSINMDMHNSKNIVYSAYGKMRVWYSTNGGRSFDTSNAMHFDIRSIFIADGKVMVGTDGETVVSTDQGKTFNNISAGISNIELWGFGAAFKSDVLAAGCNHGPLMIRDYDGKGGWYRAFGADQQNTDVNPLDDNLVITRGYGTRLVARTGIAKFTCQPTQVDPGREDWFNNLSYQPNLYNTIISHTAGNFPTPEQQHPTGERLQWRNSLLRSNDNGLTIASFVHTFDDRLMSEAISLTDTNRIYCIVSPRKNHLWKTADGGKNWEEITPDNSVTGVNVRNISGVAVSDKNPDEIWVTYSGVQNTCKVLHSTDGGKTYTNITTSTLGSYPITKILFQRGTDGGVYVGNKSGVFYRNHKMKDWTRLGTGLPMLDVRNMFVNYFKEKLLIGTSRGAWEHDLFEHSSTMAQISASTRTPDATSPKVQFRDYSVVSGKGKGATYLWKFPGGKPSTSTVESPLVNYKGAAPGNYDVTLTVTDQYGTQTKTWTQFVEYNQGN